MGAPTEPVSAVDQKEMRLCYVFSSSETDNRAEVETRANTFLKNHRSTFRNRYLACGTLERLERVTPLLQRPEAEQGSAAAVGGAGENGVALERPGAARASTIPRTVAEKGEEDIECECYPGYLFFMKFRYLALDEVAQHVLDGRTYFQGHLSHTLTLLEYPRFVGDEKARGLTPSEEHRALQKVGILLVQSRTGAVGIPGKKELENCCTKESRTCVEVLGPYDYVMEFPAETHDELRAMYKSVKDEMGSRCLRIIPMLCTIFHPPPAGRAPPPAQTLAAAQF